MSAPAPAPRRAPRPSSTAQLAALCRASFTRDGQFDDPLAQRLLTGRFRVMLALRALARPYLQAKMPGTYAFMLARSRFFERSLLGALAGGARQVVFLGAGYDTRPYRLRFGDARLFEVDATPTSAHKQRLVRARLGPTPAAVTYVPVDFETESWEQKLLAAGFDPGQRAHFVWEGVTFYLRAEAVARVLSFVSRAAAGSDLAFDHLYHDVPGGQSPRYGAQAGAAFVRAQGEPFAWGLEEGTEADFLATHGLRLAERLGSAQLDELVRHDGLNERVSGMYGLLRAEVASA